jgi:pyruvate,water dikinase
MLGLVGMGTQVERTEGEPPDTLLVTLTGEPVRRQRSEFTLDIFFDEDAVKAGLSGGKGSSLARLQAIPGIVVPEGFIVTTHAYDAFIAQSGELLRRIEEIEVLSLHWITKSWAVRQQFDAARGGADAGACVPELESLEARIRKMSEDIRGLMAAIPVPAEVERCVLAEYARMEATFRRLNIPVAVRSSSVAEDTSEASFAGQHDTFLNQVGRRQVLESLRNCWISVFGERAVFYRNHASLRLLAGSGPPDGKDVHFRHRLAKMAVVVQRMVEGAAAGVGFSLDPSSGRDDVTLNANFGLGESVVQGGIGSPDKMVFSSRNLDLHVAVCGRKERQVVSLGLRGGVEWRNVPETDRHRLVLTPERGAEIARAVLKVKEKYGRDVDTEFVLEPSGTLYFVQARPVTTSDPTVQTVESGQVGEPFFLVAFVRGQGSHAA